MIGIINYGMGNIHSLLSAAEHLNIKIKICNNKNDLKEVDKIILPGVGAFGNCIDILKSQNLYDELNYQVKINKKKILGICLGMQIMATKSLEFGKNYGFDWISGVVEEMSIDKNLFKLPHVGWNSLVFKKKSLLFEGIGDEDDFYFVHSYSFVSSDHDDIIATFNYSKEFTSSINKENIFGVQFHPEKSQDKGLKILENFSKL